MKKVLSLLLLSFAFATYASAQLKDPVQWSFNATKKADKLYELKIIAIVPKPWHIYSQTTPAGGPVATSFSFKSNPLALLEGKVKEEGKLEVIHDPNFGVDVKYYSDQVVFLQSVKLKTVVKTNISGTLEYMVCNDSKCLPPKKLPFSVQLQ